MRVIHAGSSGIVGEGDDTGGAVSNRVGVVLGLTVGLGNWVRFGEGVGCGVVRVDVGFGVEVCGGFWIATGFISG